MGLTTPGTPWLSVLPGNLVLTFQIPGGPYNDFAYQPVALLTAALPTPSATYKFARAWVSDATSRTFGAAPTGGGSDIVPVFCDGTTWYIG